MALTEELLIYKACYDLVLAVFNLVKNFKKDFKYTIGESLKNVGCVQDAAVAHWYHSATEEEAEKYFWVVVRHEIVFKYPARAGDEIIVKTRVGGSTVLSFERLTDIYRAPDNNCSLLQELSGVLLIRNHCFSRN